MRWDQHGWDHYGMANLWDVTMGSDANGNIVAADWQTYGQPQSNIDETKRLLGTRHVAGGPGHGRHRSRRLGDLRQHGDPD